MHGIYAHVRVDDLDFDARSQSSSDSARLPLHIRYIWTRHNHEHIML